MTRLVDILIISLTMASNTNDPSLSICITYFNEGEGLTRCLESLNQQGELPQQILIYDDASTLAPEPFLPNWFRGEVLRGKHNIGPGLGRNQMLERCSTDYVHFHDADDLFLTGWLHQVREAIQEGAGVVFTEIDSVVDGGETSDCIQLLPAGADRPSLIRFALQNAILTSAGTYRTDLVHELGGYRRELWQSEDYDFHLRILATEEPFKLITEPLIRRTCVAGRSGQRVEVWESALDSLQYLVEEKVLPSYQNEIAEAAARISSNLFHLGARDKAREGFGFALSVGRPEFRNQNRLYRWLATHASQELAEWTGFLYRSILPDFIRSKVNPGSP